MALNDFLQNDHGQYSTKIAVISEDKTKVMILDGLGGPIEARELTDYEQKQLAKDDPRAKRDLFS